MPPGDVIGSDLALHRRVARRTKAGVLRPVVLRRQADALGACARFTRGEAAPRHRRGDRAVLVSGQPLRRLWRAGKTEARRTRGRPRADAHRCAAAQRRRLEPLRRDRVQPGLQHAVVSCRRHGRRARAGHATGHQRALSGVSARRPPFPLLRERRRRRSSGSRVHLRRFDRFDGGAGGCCPIAPAVYARPGRLLYNRNGMLVAHAFDAEPARVPRRAPAGGGRTGGGERGSWRPIFGLRHRHAGRAGPADVRLSTGLVRPRRQEGRHPRLRVQERRAAIAPAVAGRQARRRPAIRSAPGTLDRRRRAQHVRSLHDGLRPACVLVAGWPQRDLQYDVQRRPGDLPASG